MQEDITLKIKELLDATPCYILYDTETLFPICSSGSTFDNIPDGIAQTTISYSDHADLIEGRKDLRKLFLKLVPNDPAMLCPFEDVPLPTEYVSTPFTIKDLNPRAAFFNYLGIPFVLKDNILTVTFSEDILSEESVKYFEYRIKGAAMRFKLFITEYSDPTKLHETVDIIISDLYAKRTLQYTLADNYNKISVWATRI
jgi:hypothetical protein